MLTPALSPLRGRRDGPAEEALRPQRHAAERQRGHLRRPRGLQRVLLHGAPEPPARARAHAARAARALPYSQVVSSAYFKMFI